MKYWIVLAMTLAGGLAVRAADDEIKLPWKADFEKADVDKFPDGMMKLDGEFVVKSEGGNKVLELPGAPLETFGVMFGPARLDGLAVAARAQGSAKGRRMPTFAVGLNSGGFFKLKVAPAKKLVELYKGDDVVATAAYVWKTESWTELRLQTRKVKDGEWVIEGKVWEQGQPEPKAWTVTTRHDAEPPSGQPSIWGLPFAGTPIRFDDLKVTEAVKP